MTEENNTTPPAVKYLVRLLSKRDYSEHKLRQKLREKEYDKEEADFAIAYVVEKNWLREENYTKARIQAFLRKGLSQQHIVQKLKLEKITITSDDIDIVAKDISLDSDTQINGLLQKKFGKFTLSELKDQKQRAKMIRFLMSKGHSYDSISTALKEFLGSYEEDAHPDF